MEIDHFFGNLPKRPNTGHVPFATDTQGKAALPQQPEAACPQRTQPVSATSSHSQITAVPVSRAQPSHLGNILRTLATPEPIEDWSMTTLKEKLIKIGAKVVSHGVSHGRYVAFQMTQVAIPRNLFADILRMIAELRSPPITSAA